MEEKFCDFNKIEHMLVFQAQSAVTLTLPIVGALLRKLHVSNIGVL